MCNKLPQNWWLKTVFIYHLSVLWVRSLGKFTSWDTKAEVKRVTWAVLSSEAKEGPLPDHVGIGGCVFSYLGKLLWPASSRTDRRPIKLPGHFVLRRIWLGQTYTRFSFDYFKGNWWEILIAFATSLFLSNVTNQQWSNTPSYSHGLGFPLNSLLALDKDIIKSRCLIQDIQTSAIVFGTY